MNKKEVLKAIDIASYLSLIVASVGVLIFEFSGLEFALRAAIVLYATAFLIYVVLNILKLVYFVRKTEFEGATLIDMEKTKLWHIITKLVVGCLIFALSVVVLVMY